MRILFKTGGDDNLKAYGEVPIKDQQRIGFFASGQQFYKENG